MGFSAFFKQLIVKAFLSASLLLGEKYPLLTVLGYHSVSRDNTLIDVLPEEFEKQIAYLSQKGYHFISLYDAYAYMQGKLKLERPSVLLTFDDGYADLLTNVVPTLEKYRIPATYFVVSDGEHVDRAILENTKPLLRKSTIAQLAKITGAAIQAHTTTHALLTEKAIKVISEDVEKAKKDLTRITKRPVEFFSYPWGRYNNNYIVALQQAGYKGAFTTEPGFVHPQINYYTIPRIMVDRTHSLDHFKFMLTPLYPMLAFVYFSAKAVVDLV